MPRLENDRLLRALARESVDRTPVWLMRQAGRYLPEYRKTRAQAGSFLELCGTPELACEVALQPLRRYALDAAILFSDILTIPWVMGLGLEFTDGEGPRFASPIRSRADIDRLGVPDPEQELGFVLDTTRLIRAELRGQVPLIGFAGSPWTLATYMVEGGSSKDFRTIKGLMFDEARALHRLLEILSQAVAVYLNAQIAAGAQALMVFDTWGGMLSTTGYSEFSLRYLERVVGELMREHEGRRVPVVLFTKGGGEWLERCADTGCDALGLDWSVDLRRARARVGGRVALQGNLDPTVLHASDERIREEVAQVLAAFGGGTGHVFNLGHGVQPGTAPERVAACIDAVHALSPAYHDAT